MIQLPAAIKPSQVILDQLNAFQIIVNAEETYELKREKAKTLFKSKNVKTNPAFKEVRKHLTEMCNSTRRCVYCEDSVANQVEHIYPKDFYPEKCFDWENYVYACGPCNGPKNNLFAIFNEASGDFQRINPPHWPNDSPPPGGKPVLINPRIENPLDFAILDLKDTFLFFLLPGLNETDSLRAEYTFNEILKMNEPDREMLRQARENAFGNFKDAFYSFIKREEEGGTPEKLERIISRIKKENHQTVWKEMQRWHIMGILKEVDDELDDYFIQKPAALTW